MVNTVSKVQKSKELQAEIDESLDNIAREMAAMTALSIARHHGKTPDTRIDERDYFDDYDFEDDIFDFGDSQGNEIRQDTHELNETEMIELLTRCGLASPEPPNLNLVRDQQLSGSIDDLWKLAFFSPVLRDAMRYNLRDVMSIWTDISCRFALVRAVYGEHAALLKSWGILPPHKYIIVDNLSRADLEQEISNIVRETGYSYEKVIHRDACVYVPFTPQTQNFVSNNRKFMKFSFDLYGTLNCKVVHEIAK